MTNTPKYNVLDNILHFVSTEIRHAKPLYPDISIQNQFHEIYFDELSLIIALVKFEMDYLVDIPDEFCDYRLTFRQFAQAVALLPRIELDKVEEFRTGKYKMLEYIADGLREELGKKHFIS